MFIQLRNIFIVNVKGHNTFLDTYLNENISVPSQKQCFLIGI